MLWPFLTYGKVFFKLLVTKFSCFTFLNLGNPETLSDGRVQKDQVIVENIFVKKCSLKESKKKKHFNRNYQLPICIKKLRAVCGPNMALKPEGST